MCKTVRGQFSLVSCTVLLESDSEEATMATTAISLDTESTNSNNPDFKEALKELEATMDNR